jgi:GTPase SAR1 family protein
MRKGLIMNLYSSLKEELLQLNQDILFLLNSAKKIPGMSDDSFIKWERTCSDIYRQISEEIVRVAVVGAIKSGKSTFVNSLLNGDYLKRGAGVVTSIVTKIQKGQKLSAKLFLKSWDEVNSELQQALVLFPSFKWPSENKSIDIRQNKDRMELQKALDSLSSEYLFTNDARNINSVLITLYLKGYDRVKDMISSENKVKNYGPDQFFKHMDFVGDDSMAVFLKDMQLEIVDSSLESNIQIADCQGSDSPNPLHLAMIQDYLLRTHLIVYVISSRTGLRRADIRFLSMIRKMGIMENIIFVINCDFSEHDSLEEFSGLLQKIKNEIALIKSDPEVYAFSALYHLFKSQKNRLPEKDEDRLGHWEKEGSLIEFSGRQFEAFNASLHKKLTSEKYFLLLKNHLERMSVVGSGFKGWIGVSRDLLSRDSNSAAEINEKVKQHQIRITQLESVIKNTLDGAVEKLKKDLKKDVDRFFDTRDGDVINRIIDYIHGYSVTYESNGDQLRSTGFTNTLYYIFQEFKQGLDTFMTESINPEIIRFIKELEKKTEEHMMLIGKPYDGLIQEAIAEYNDTMQNYGICLGEDARSLEIPDISTIKNISELWLPPAGATLHYSTKIKTEAIMRLGFYRVVGLIRKAIRRSSRDKTHESFSALKDGVKRMKRETEKSIISHFKDYRENIKYQYVFKLVDAVSKALFEALLDRFQTYVTDLSKLVEGIEGHKEGKDGAAGSLEEMESVSTNIQERIQQIRKKISQEV